MLARTDRRRFPILLAVIAALAMAMLFSPVQAQEGSAPDKPRGLEATATHDSVTLTWDDPGDDTITGYVILRRIPAVDPQGQFSELVSDTGTAATTYTDDTVAAETRYTYRIKAINGAGTSERSRWSHIDVPAAPGGPGKRANVSEGNTDCPNDVSTTCEVDVGGSVTGNLSSRTDFDWFRVDLEADTRYQIDLEGEDTGRGTLPDPVLLLYDGAGSFETDNETSGVGDNAREIYTPTATGTYYVGTGEVDGETGTYTLSVIVLGANGASEQDTDFPETTSTTGRVEVGASATGNIGTETDYDWFKVVLEANKTYQIDLEGDTGGGGTLGDPYLRNIRDSSGTEISGTENDDIVGGVADSRVVFTLTADGAYYLVASGFDGTYTGTYTLSVTELETRTEEGDTDFANDVTTLGRVEVGGSATGEIENVADSDWFRVVLEKDKTYVFDLEGTETSSGTLADPLLLLRDASGSTLEGDDDGGDGANSRLEYTATADGIHYLTATTPTSATSGGTYTLSVSEVETDDVSEGSTILVSNIEQDTHSFFNIKVSRDKAQQFTTGGNTSGYNLDSVELKVGNYENVMVTVRLYSDSSGNPGTSIFTFTNPTAGVVANSDNTFTAPANTTLMASTPYHIVVSGADDPDETSNDFRLDTAASDDEDEGGAVNSEGTADWEIGDNNATLDTQNPPQWAEGTTRPFMIRVNGTAVGATPAVSTDATLELLAVVTDSSALVGYQASTSSYTMSVPNSDDEATVTATANHTGATVEYLDGSDTEQVDADSTEDGHQVALDVGDTVFKVKVTAEDGTTTQTYTVTVTRAACALNEGDIWCGVVTVGDITNDRHGFLGTTGGLSDETFSLMFETGTTNNYTILAIQVASELLYFVTDSGLTDTEVESLALHVDGESDPFVWSDSTAVIPRSYRWPARTGLDWSSETTVTLRLREFPRPRVTNVAVTSTPVLETDTYGAGERIEVSVTFSEAVDATSDTDFVLSVGGARRAPLVSGSGTATLVFGYAVVSSDEDTNGIWIGDETRTLVGSRNGEAQNGTITSVATGAAAVIAHTALGTASDHKVDGSRTTDNVAPSFTTSATLSIPENTDRLTVVAEDSDTDDDITGYAITGGADNSHFSSVSSSGELQFVNNPSFENPQDSGADNTYEVTVQATSGTGTREMTATRTFTVTVTDVAEQSAKPDKPTLAAVSGSSTSLTATWEAPDKNGGPAITGYDLQYKESTESSWEDFAHTGTAVTTTITGLTADTSYQARVLAKNGETDSDWSDASDAVSTNAGTALPTLSIADAEGDEDDGVEFTATLTSGVSGKVTATWTASIESGDTASAADLATTKTGEVEFDENATEATFTVQVNDDTTDEPDQTFTVTLSGVSENAQLAADPTAEGTIDDDDPAPTLDVADATASEGDNLEFAVTLSAKSEKTVTAKWVAVHPDDTASTADFVWDGIVTTTFDPGQDEKTVTVATVEDALDEDAEIFTVEALEITNVDAGDIKATGTITDNDPTPTVTVADAAATEGDKVEFTVTLSAVSGRDVEVDYATSVATDDTAVSGTDFTAATGTLTILAADSTATGTIEVQTTEDDATEDDETFTLTLSATKNVDLGTPSTAKGTINDVSEGNVAVLLSNLGQDTDEFASAAVGAFDAAQGFTTGSARSGYFLDSIKLDVKEVPNTPADVTVQLWSASNGNPDASIATLTHSTGSWDTGVNTFSASPAQVLAATTKYFVVLLYSGARTYLNVNITQTDSADDASTEWEVTGRRLERGSDNQWRGVSGQYLKFSVGGRVTAEGGTDLPANATTSGVVEVDGSAARGDIYEPVFVERTGDDDVDGWDFDTDWFAVELKAGQTYRIDMKGALLSSDTDLTLRLPEITAIYDADGNFLVNTWYSDESDSHYLFRVTFNASTDGTYYIAASGESHEWGTYKLRVKDITEDDDEHTAAQRGLKNLRAVEEKGGVRLTWQPPDGAAVTGYRIERRRAGGQDSGPQRSHGQPRDHHTLVEDTGNTETSYVDESAEQGVEYEYRVTARNESGPGEESDWVRAGPASASNNPATGAPTISGTTQVGETLTADISGIADADGLSGETFTYQWVSSDGTTDTDIENATGSTYTLIAADQGKAIKVRVTFTDDAGNAETLTSTPTEPVLGDGPPGAPRNLTATAGNKEITLSWEPPDDNGNAPATRYRIEWRVDGKDYDKNHWGTARSTTYTTNDQANLANGVKYFFRVKAENDDGNSYGPYGPASEEVSATPTSGSAVDLGTPVLSDTETLHHGMVKLDWQDIEDAGWYVVQYYHLEDEEWLDLPAEGVDIAFHGSSAVVSNLHGLSWLRVGAASCAGSSEWSQIEQLFGTNASDWEGVPVPEVEEGDEIEPCPVVLGTPVLSDTETLHHGMVQLDWEDIEDAGWYVVQYYHVDGGSGEWLDLPAAGVDIAFHGSSAVVSNLHGLSWLRVRAMSCAGESEWSQIEQSFGTNASDWEGVPVPEVAEGDEIEPCSEDADTPDNSPATGAPTIGGTAQVGQTLTSNTSGIADADGLSNVQYEYQWLADDSEISGATNATYTLVAADEGKAVKVQVSFTDDADNEETLTSAATDAVAAAPTPNTPATGAPTISGTAQVGETLTANTSGVTDADGLSNVQYEYQWLADDADISGATNDTYTLVAADEGKVIKVRVSFTDDADNEETLTSAATGAVDARPNSPATGAPTIAGTAQVGQTVTADTSGIADADGLANATFSFQWLADDSEIAGATGLTYTLTNTDEGKAITVQVSFTDDEGNAETLTSAATAAVAGAHPTEPPATPKNLSATASHDSVTLTWDDPGDDTITGYVILRRIPGVDPEGHFDELVADTGTDATTYTDNTVAAETRYTYRIKAINGAGTSERSRWSHIDTPAAPVPDKPTGLEATESHGQVVLTWDDPGDDSITGYVILRRIPGVDPEGHFDVLVADTGTDATTYTDDTVAAGATYTYRIKAINEHGTSERSRWYHIDIPEAP